MAENFTEHVASTVRAELARRGRPQRVLAEVLGLSEVATSRRLRGVTPFRVDELAKVAAYFGVSVSTLTDDRAMPANASP